MLSHHTDQDSKSATVSAVDVWICVLIAQASTSPSPEAPVSRRPGRLIRQPDHLLQRLVLHGWLVALGVGAEARPGGKPVVPAAHTSRVDVCFRMTSIDAPREQGVDRRLIVYLCAYACVTQLLHDCAQTLVDGKSPPPPPDAALPALRLQALEGPPQSPHQLRSAKLHAAAQACTSVCQEGSWAREGPNLDAHLMALRLPRVVEIQEVHRSHIQVTGTGTKNRKGSGTVHAVWM